MFPRDDFYSILKGFGEITIETPQSPTSDEFFSLKATTERMEGMGAEGRLSRIHESHIPYAPNACWQVRLYSDNQPVNSDWLIHAISYYALLLSNSCRLYRPADGALFANVEDCYTYLLQHFRPEQYLTGDGTLLI